VLGLPTSLARELGGRGIRVNAICPGATNTRMMAGISPDYAKQMVASIPLGRMGEPQEVANTALFLASEEGSYFTGQTLAANGGWQML
jgi:NAD(P)-dependent dehydrogenase (short-subunit alcohol dehydrogenase family)